jgi:alcohol dehydrogenase (cytochrome c)
MKVTQSTARWVLVVGFIATALVSVASLRSLENKEAISAGELGDMLWWRASVFGRKATGRLPDLSWSELWQMSRVRGGFGLAGVVRKGLSLDGAVENPFNSETDRRAGGRIYRERCAGCHGSEGKGWHAPALNRSGFRNGDSDLSIYKVLRDGIPDTPMARTEVSAADRWRLVGYVRALQIQGSGAESEEPRRPPIYVGDDQIRKAGQKTDEWLTYSGSLDGQHYTPLDEITPANASRLRLRWMRQFETTAAKLEATPLVVNNVIFMTDGPNGVVALDAKSGGLIWRYHRNIAYDLPLCCGRVNRGLAILGDKLFMGTLDGVLIAIDANTGQPVWQRQVASSSEGYTITGAPLIANRLVIVGVAGGEYGIRGLLAAYDSEEGQLRWKFNTIPGPGELGHETWKNGAWQSGGGPTWITGAFDPELDVLYWGVGNPSPSFSGRVRPGDNLFTNSVIALHASTGTLAWHFQFTPHDEHDWDSTQTPILANLAVEGSIRKVICWANRNGFYYVLDRVTGKFLTGVPFVDQNWTKGLDSHGRPVPADSGEVSQSGRLTKPSVAGGTNWQNAAFDPLKRLIFIPATEGASVYTKAANPTRGDRGIYLASAGSVEDRLTPVVRALDALSGQRKWEYFSPRFNEPTFSYGGLLASGGGLVIGTSGGSAFAVDSATGREIWRVFLGGDTRAAPISFVLDGRQVIALSVGRSLFVFGL